MKRSKTSYVAAVATCAALAASGPPASAAGESRTWIVGATVISPERADEGQKLNVLVVGDRIAAVTPGLPAGAGREATIVDAGGQYLIPGLIDAHVHLSGVPGMTPVMQYRHPLLTRDYRRQQPRSYLRYGYTTVIDLVPVDRDVLEDFLAAPAHPDVHHCGAVPLLHGYPTTLAPRILRSRIFRDAVVEPRDGGDPQHAPAAAVARAKQEGAICIKTFFERGFGRDRDLPVPSPALFAGIVKSARGAGLPVLLHASSVEAQRFGVQGGAAIFAHGLWNWGAENEAATLPAAAREVLDEVASRRIGYMPTFQVLAGLRALYEPGFFDQPAVRRVVPPALLEWYRSPAGRWFKEEVANGASDERMRAVFDAPLRRATESTRHLARKDALFLFGSDTPSGPTPANLPGLNGYLEMRRLVAAGVTLRQLLAAATLNNAQAFGLADRVGTVAVGKRANLLLLARSPLETVDAYDTVSAVWIAGRRLEPEELEARH